jgi:hypothetical protein
VNANFKKKMIRISIYEPAAGCLTGACGPDQEDALAGLELALDALKLRGVEVNRYNLGHDPEEFAANGLVKSAIKESGMLCLPMVLVDGQVLSKGRYPLENELSSTVGAI